MRLVTLLTLISFVVLAAGLAYGDVQKFSNKVQPAPKDTEVTGRPTGESRDAVGDNMGVPIWIGALPYTHAGNTCQYIHDYDEVCPYTDSSSPDVVYGFSPAKDMGIRIDLCLSSYDTKVYVYDVTGNPIACNDDFYFGDPPECYAYSSCLECVELTANNKYYIVVDGYGGDCGDYSLNITECEIVDGSCPEGSVLELEKACYDWYTIPDTWNGGCNSNPEVFQVLEPECDGTVTVCGWGGTDPGGQGFRDTDWYEITLTEPSMISMCCVGEIPLDMFILDTTAGCAGVIDIHAGTAPTPGVEACIGGPLDPGTYWLWVGPNDFYSIPCGEYVMTITGYYPEGGASATERKSWGTIKNQYK